jgi:hypothetical protein
MSWWEVILYFGDIGGMVGHHCCNFLFIIPVFLMYFYHVHLHSHFFLWPVIAMTIFVASHCYGNCMFPVIAMIIVCDQSLQWQFLWPVIAIATVCDQSLLEQLFVARYCCAMTIVCGQILLCYDNCLWPVIVMTTVCYQSLLWQSLMTSHF